MADRVDALADRYEDPTRFSGNILEEALDDQLQRVVRTAAQELNAPIALVSLILQRVQFFKAYHGLPPPLNASRATDRDISFCQFVVRDRQPLAVARAQDDPRLPQALVKQYGIQSYLGVPVYAGEEAVGSLCVIDIEERTFDEDQLSRLIQLSRLVSARLTELAKPSEPPPTRAFESGVRPAFAEIRNALTPMAFDLAAAENALASIAPAARLAAAGFTDASEHFAVLASLPDAVKDLQVALQGLERFRGRVTADLEALEAACLSDAGQVGLSEAVSAAARLTSHVSKIVGGLLYEPISISVALAMTRPQAVAAIASLISVTAHFVDVDSPDPGIRLEWDIGPEQVGLATRAAIRSTVMETARGELVELLTGIPGASVADRTSGLTLRLPREQEPTALR